MSTKYLSTRGGSYGCSFEEVVLQGLAKDGGLFIPEEIPSAVTQWKDEWLSWDFQKLAFEIFSLFISRSEIPADDLNELVRRTYSDNVFRNPEVAPLIKLDDDKPLYLMELFHGPTFAFKDVALQLLGNLFEYFLRRRNANLPPGKRQHLTVIGATSGDTGSAAIYGLKGKDDVSIMILFPEGRISPVQEAQMTSVLDANVHNVAIEGGTFDDCQDFVKALFGDADIQKTHQLAAVNSINWARILAQITYYIHSYASLVRSSKVQSGEKVRFIVPTGNFGDILAGYFAKLMGFNIDLRIATNENDILDRFWKTGAYEKHPVHGDAAKGGFPADGVLADEGGVKQTYSPAMDILVSSNFERLLWLLAYQVHGGSGTAESKRQIAGERVNDWYNSLRKSGGFSVDKTLLDAARENFSSERVSNAQTLETIARVYSKGISGQPSAGTSGTIIGKRYVLDPHTAIGVHVSERSLAEDSSSATLTHVSLATAHPAKFAAAVTEALSSQPDFEFAKILPPQFQGLDALQRRKTLIPKNDGIQALRREIRARVPSSSVQS